MRTSMIGLKRWMDAHPRKKVNGYFSVNGRDLTDAEVRRIVSYAVDKGYETEADIPSEELAQLLNMKEERK